MLLDFHRIPSSGEYSKRRTKSEDISINQVPIAQTRSSVCEWFQFFRNCGTTGTSNGCFISRRRRPDASTNVRLTGGTTAWPGRVGTSLKDGDNRERASGAAGGFGAKLSFNCGPRGQHRGKANRCNCGGL